MKKVQKALIEDGYYESENNWRKSLIPYQIKRNLSLIISIILLITATKAFWGEVEKVLPDYKAQVRWLKDEGGNIMRRNG